MSVTTPQQAVDAVQTYGGLRAASRSLKVPYHDVRGWYLKAVEQGLAEPLPPRGTTRPTKSLPKGEKSALSVTKDFSKRKGVQRYLFTSAQNNTEVHEGFWENLLVLAEHYNAEIHVARYIYIKSGLGAAGDKSNVVSKQDALGAESELSWDAKVEPYLSDHRIKVTKDCMWCGETNTLPTAVDPLSGMESYTGAASGIFPHPKVMQSPIAGIGHDSAKFNYTTGTCTLRNYIQRKAGLKADFHHTYGALLIEVDTDGVWFSRQIVGTDGGTICDLNLKVEKGELTDDNPLSAITFGDIHAETMTAEVESMCWDHGGVVDALQPEVQVFHDTLDFQRRSHHSRDNFHARFAAFQSGAECVKEEVQTTCQFIDYAAREWCETVIVASNHDEFATRWLREVDYRTDVLNAKFFLECQLAVVTAIEEEDKEFSLMRYFTSRFCDSKPTVLLTDQSYKVHGIENGQHGHNGPNGAPGNFKSFAKLGMKFNTAHNHSPRIYLGVAVAGMMGDLNQRYTKGPSSWATAWINTYCNGKRSLVVCRHTPTGLRWKVND